LVEPTPDGQAGFDRGAGDQLDDHLVGRQGLATSAAPSSTASALASSTGSADLRTGVAPQRATTNAPTLASHTSPLPSSSCLDDES
jgi:hypothetical protein